MSASADSPPAAMTPAYARFSRRLRGLAIDWIVFLLMLAGALFVATAMQSDTIGRYLGFSAMAIFLLYEPVLVSLTGGTIGHYLTNLRVVDNRTKGNVSLLKAFARFVIKSLLGWYSFISMWITRRHQAIHDLMTFSTVQIRDPAKAQPHQYHLERPRIRSFGDAVAHPAARGHPRISSFDSRRPNHRRNGPRSRGPCHPSLSRP